MLLFILYNVLQGSDKNIVICQQYTYSPEPHMGSLLTLPLFSIQLSVIIHIIFSGCGWYM